jgi:hypothetical protein
MEGKLENYPQEGSVKSSTVVDCYMDQLEQIYAMIGDCRARNAGIENKLSFVLGDQTPTKDSESLCGEKEARDTLSVRLKSIITQLHGLECEQNEFISRIEN